MRDADPEASASHDAAPPPAARRHGILLTLAYDGAQFSGFAPQANARTIASVLAEAIAKMDGSASALRVASRTDAGVHARGQRVCFDTSARIDSRGWLLGLSAHLPPQVAVQRVARVEAGFQPSRNARAKTYRYSLLQGTVRDPFLHSRAWRVHQFLDLDLMREEAGALVGTHDFRAFRGAADIRTHTLRTMHSAELVRHPSHPRCLDFTLCGDRFMYNMVRIIVGTLVDVGRGRIPPGAVRRGIETGDREALGMTAPPDGLCLEEVELSEPGTHAWPDHW